VTSDEDQQKVIRNLLMQSNL